jgi:hypothetical protein
MPPAQWVETHLFGKPSETWHGVVIEAFQTFTQPAKLGWIFTFMKSMPHTIPGAVGQVLAGYTLGVPFGFVFSKI